METSSQNTASTSSTPKKPTVPGGFSLFKPSYQAVMLNLGTCLALVTWPIAYFVILSLLGVIGGRSFNIAVFILEVFGLIGTLLLYPAVTIVQIKSAQRVKVNVNEALKLGLHYFGRMIGLAIVMGFLFLVGFVLLIVPGVIFVSKYYLAPYHMIDKNLGIMEALKASAAASKGYGWTIWSILGVNIVYGLLSIIPFLGVIVGSVLQFLYSFAPAITYINIKNASSPVAASTTLETSAPTPPAPVQPIQPLPT